MGRQSAKQAIDLGANAREIPYILTSYNSLKKLQLNIYRRPYLIARAPSSSFLFFLLLGIPDVEVLTFFKHIQHTPYQKLLKIKPQIPRLSTNKSNSNPSKNGPLWLSGTASHLYHHD